MNYFTLYDDTTGEGESKTSLSFGVGLSGSGVWNAPARKGESISIPGRNGAIWVDDGAWENILVTYPCWMAEGFDDRVDEFRGWLASHSDKYYRITDTYHPDEYRLGRFAGEFSATPGTRNKSGRFDVVFDCDPRRFYGTDLEYRNEYVTTSAASTVTYTFNNPSGVELYPVAKIELNTPAYHPFHSYYYDMSLNDAKFIEISSPDPSIGAITVYADLSDGAVYADEEMKTPIIITGEPGLSVSPVSVAPGNNTIKIRGYNEQGGASGIVVVTLTTKRFRL